MDDTCAQAYAIGTNGATQLHTFHTAEDVDWAFFQAVAGTTYIIEATTSTDSEADEKASDALGEYSPDEFFVCVECQWDDEHDTHDEQCKCKATGGQEED